MRYRCLTGTNKETQKAFLSLPKQIYKKDCPQNVKTEKQILNGTHPLSPDFEIYPYVITDDNKKPICRCVLTIYSNADVAYVGFFEAKNDLAAVKEMMTHVRQKAMDLGKTKILGPIDCSIYINYRFKTNLFEKTYTGEPYNKEYYPKLWEQCGFVIKDKYVSNQMRQVTENNFDVRLDRIYQRYLDRGYTFRGPYGDFQRALKDVYSLLVERYSGFVGAQPVSEAQFMSLFSYIEKIADYDMIKLAYKGEELKGFCIALPNYNLDSVGDITLMKLLRILKTKKNPKEYVILYAGADEKSPGLGGALMHSIRNELYKNQCTSIAALIHEGNMPQQVYTMLHTEQFQYILMEYTL